MTLDIKYFYLNTPMERFEYMRLKLTDLPADVIKHYDLNAKVTTDGYVYVEIRRGMYRLLQVGLIAQQLLEESLNKEGYSQSERAPGLWTHKWRPITFSLWIDDFGVKYVGKEHANHLMSVLQPHYVVLSDWTGKRYISLDLDWDYSQRKVHLSMLTYVLDALKRFHHHHPQHSQD